MHIKFVQEVTWYNVILHRSNSTLSFLLLFLGKNVIAETNIIRLCLTVIVAEEQRKDQFKG